MTVRLKAISVQGHLAGAGGPDCFSVVVYRHVGSWAGTEWVLEDSIQDAVGKTILRGPRPPSVRWEKQRSQLAAAHPAKDRKDSKKDAKAKDSAQVQQKARCRKLCQPSRDQTVSLLQRRELQLKPTVAGRDQRFGRMST